MDGFNYTSTRIRPRGTVVLPVGRFNLGGAVDAGSKTCRADQQVLKSPLANHQNEASPSSFLFLSGSHTL